MNEYDPKGGYVKGMSITEKYNTWAAAQYREKVGWREGVVAEKWGESLPVQD
jgi:ADP-ribosylation factor GTPase-activating protein 1